MRLHHVAALGRSFQRSKGFYTQGLGLSVAAEGPSFDDPKTPMIRFTDTAGRGLHMLFYPGCRRGVVGVGGIRTLTFSVTAAELPKRISCLDRFRTKYEFSETGIYFRDPDGLCLRLVEGVQPGVNLVGVSVDVLNLETERRFWREVADSSRSLEFLCLVANGPLPPHRIGFGVCHHLAAQGSYKTAPLGSFQREGYRSSYLYSPAGLLCELVTQ